MIKNNRPLSLRRKRFLERGEQSGPERAEWLAAARDMLIKDGIQAVKVDRLARVLGVTRGGFYWRFADHQELLDALLEDWRTTNGRSMTVALETDETPVARFRNFTASLIDESNFSPRYDMAVRAWAQTSEQVATVVRLVDDYRLKALTKLFRQAEYSEAEADIRARVTYYHQIGFYALNEGISQRHRRRTSELYMRILIGFDVSEAPPKRKAASPKARTPGKTQLR